MDIGINKLNVNSGYNNMLYNKTYYKRQVDIDNNLYNVVGINLLDKNANYKMKFSLDLNHINSLNHDFKFNNNLYNPKAGIYKIQDSKYNNSLLKISDGRVYINKAKCKHIHSFFGVKKYLNDPSFIKKYKSYYIFYDFNDLFLIKKNNTAFLGNIEPNNNISDNLNNLDSLGIFLINKVYLSNTYKYVGIFEYKNKLFGFFVKKINEVYKIKNILDLSYSILKKHNFLFNIDNDYYSVSNENINTYYLGDKNLYKNIDVSRLANILSPTFYSMGILGDNYIPIQLKNIILFSSLFNNKNLSTLYNFMIYNFNYSTKISSILKNNKANLIKEIDNNVNLMKYWVIFNTFEKKKGVCESFSSMFSLVSLFNGLDSEIIHVQYGKKRRDHSISKVGNYYYDVTFGIGMINRNKDFYAKNFFGIKEKDLKKFNYYLLK